MECRFCILIKKYDRYLITVSSCRFNSYIVSRPNTILFILKCVFYRAQAFVYFYQLSTKRREVPKSFFKRLFCNPCIAIVGMIKSNNCNKKKTYKIGDSSFYFALALITLIHYSRIANTCCFLLKQLIDLNGTHLN